MQTVVGAAVEGRLALAGEPVALGARIEVPVTRAIASYWRPATVDPVTGEWVVTLDPPVTGGEYLLVWRTGDPEPPAVEVFIPLFVA